MRRTVDLRVNVGADVRAATVQRVVAQSVCLLVLLIAAAGRMQAQADAIASKDATVDGLKLHYLIAGPEVGSGPVVILLHGYTQTSRMWRPLMPALAKRFTVIAPDLPGIGDSDVPSDGLDMKTAAVRIHDLAKALGVTNAALVGHDIGLMVAYAYAAQFTSETTKLVLMDAFLPGVQGWETFYDDPHKWHYRFTGPTPEALVKGRENIYFAWFWNDLAADGRRSVPEADREAYVAAYSRPGRMRAGWGYFAAFPETAKEFAAMAQTKLTMPVLSLSGEKSAAGVLSDQVRLVSVDAKVIVLPGTGHWLMEERPQETMDALEKFL